MGTYSVPCLIGASSLIVHIMVQARGWHDARVRCVSMGYLPVG